MGLPPHGAVTEERSTHEEKLSGQWKKLSGPDRVRGVAHYGMPRKSILGLHKTYYGMFKQRTKGGERKKLSRFGKEPLRDTGQGDKRGLSMCKPVAHQYISLAVPCT